MPRAMRSSSDAAGRNTRITDPNGNYLQNSLTQVQHKTSSTGSVFGQYSYTYDAAGNRLTQVDSDGVTSTTQTFTLRLRSGQALRRAASAADRDPAGRPEPQHLHCGLP